jgi:large subunit ribosomal protein L31e
MAEEKVLTLNLRKDILATAGWKRAARVSRFLRALLKKYTKTEKIKIDKKVNEKIWRSGGRKPPTKIRLKLKKQSDGSFVAELME